MNPPIHVRRGQPGDDLAVLAMWDGAIEWMTARGQAMQWGSEPASDQPGCIERAREWATGPGLRIAESDARPVGASVIVQDPPPYVPSTALAETYLLFLISDRRNEGNGIGSELVRRAVTDARARGSEVLRVDCWAGAPGLVAWYEAQGFRRSDVFAVDVRGGWSGQVFEMTL